MSRLIQPASDKEMRQIVALGRKHAKSAFPNPNRVGCPDSTVLRAMAYRDKRLNPVDLPVSHIASCSPCFSEYTRLRRNAKTLHVFQVSVSFLMVAVVLIAVAFLVRDGLFNGELPSVSRRENTKPPPELRLPLPATKDTVPFAMTVDLAPFSPLRGEDAKGTGQIRLPAKSLRLTLLMPTGAEPGEYRVRVVKPRDEVIADTRRAARLRDGVTSLELELDLEPMAGMRLRLMIQPNGLSWREFPVIVGTL